MARKIAIIGGGISGLANAFYLVRSGTVRPHDLHIFERAARLGGNSATVEVALGSGRSRWVDMGVNDFNARSYRRLMALMGEIGFDGYHPLDDSACFFAPGTTEAMVMGEAKAGLTRDVPEAVAAVLDRFMQFAIARAGIGSETDPHVTVDQAALEYAEILDQASRAAFERCLRDILMPRISAMYFTDDTNPGAMPLLGVMDYYLLQEGVDSKPRRMCFSQGASALIDALATWLRARGVSITCGVEAEILPLPHGVEVRPGTAGAHPITGQFFDLAIVTTHAEDALKGLASAVCPELPAILGAVRYSSAVAVAHTDARSLPSDRSTWRTYNVPVRQGIGLRPYSISYVVGKHQNDSDTQLYAGEPDIFLTLNPLEPIPDDMILRRSDDGAPAVHWFRHNILDAQGLAAQRALAQWQVHPDRSPAAQRLYFAGGWTTGAGLHEQCLEQAARISAQIGQDLDTMTLQDISA